MEWSNVSAGEPLVIFIPTVDLVKLLRLNVRSLQEARRQGRFQRPTEGGDNLDAYLQAEEWLARRERNLALLEVSGEPVHYMAIYPHEPQE